MARRTLRGLPSMSSDRKSTRLNSSHSQISYAVFCLKKKKKIHIRAEPDVGAYHERRHTAARRQPPVLSPQRYRAKLARITRLLEGAGSTNEPPVTLPLSR